MKFLLQSSSFFFALKKTTKKTFHFMYLSTPHTFSILTIYMRNNKCNTWISKNSLPFLIPASITYFSCIFSSTAYWSFFFFNTRKPYEQVVSMRQAAGVNFISNWISQAVPHLETVSVPTLVVAVVMCKDNFLDFSVIQWGGPETEKPIRRSSGYGSCVGGCGTGGFREGKKEFYFIEHCFI